MVIILTARGMTETQKQAIKELVTYLKEIYPSAKIVYHRKICPGRYYSLEKKPPHCCVSHILIF